MLEATLTEQADVTTSASTTTGTLADLLHELGDLPPERVLRAPPPGTATEDDLLRLLHAPDKRLCELVDGVLVEKAMGHRESRLAMWLVVEIGIYLKENPIGLLAGPDAPHRFPLGLVRMPDVAFISFSKIPGGVPSHEPIVNWIPDLAVEVLSRSNTPTEMDRKLTQYFAAGVRLVWIADPRRRTVTVYRGIDDHRELTESDDLDGEDVLPGFRCSVRDWMSCP